MFSDYFFQKDVNKHVKYQNLTEEEKNKKWEHGREQLENKDYLSAGKDILKCEKVISRSLNMVLVF